MRKTIFGLSLLVILVAGLPAYATTDCNGVSFSYQPWYLDYSPEMLWEQKTTWDCWSLGSGLSPAYLSDSTPGFEVTGYGGQATRVFTVPANNSGHFEVSLEVDIVDPSHSSSNILYATAIVYHPGTGYTYHDIYFHNASQGDDNSNPWVDFYNVAEGDTITIYISGGISGLGGHVRFSNVHLFYNY